MIKMQSREQEYNGYLISSDPAKVRPEAVHQYLTTESYWAQGIPLQTVKTSIENSHCFGIYLDGKQVGFARWVTDYAIFGYLADVYVLSEHRGKGLSKALMAFMMEEPVLQNCRHLLLATRDAHGLYTKSGFGPLPEPDRYMNIMKRDIYLKKENQ